MATGDLITSAEFAASRGAAFSDGRDDNDIARLITAASYWLSAECGRQFYQDASTSVRKFEPSEDDCLYIDDFSTTTGLVVVDNGQTLTLDSDFYVAPLNGKGPTGESVAYYVLHKFNDMEWLDTGAGPSVSVTARWGWPAVPPAVKQGVIEVVSDLLKMRDNTFGVIGIDVGTAVRLRSNTHVAELIATYARGDRAPRFGLA